MSNNWFANEEVADKVKKELLELVPAKQIAKNFESCRPDQL